MREYVARLNIQHFQRQLAQETDEVKREMLRRLLGEEQDRLAAILAAKQEAKRPSEPR
jgi:hypothetical protein